MSFFTAISIGLEVAHGSRPPAKLKEEDYDRILRIDDAFYHKLMASPLSELLAYYATLHSRIVEELSTIDERELGQGAYFWEPDPMTIRFRLHRFGSHLLQHKVQIEKTLLALERTPTEAQRLLRHIEGALAEAEGWSIGAAAPGMEAQQEAAAEIVALAAEIRTHLQLLETS
jgi:hypothetical protein